MLKLNLVPFLGEGSYYAEVRGEEDEILAKIDVEANGEILLSAPARVLRLIEIRSRGWD